LAQNIITATGLNKCIQNTENDLHDFPGPFYVQFQDFSGPFMSIFHDFPG